MENLKNIFPFWSKLEESEKTLIENSIQKEAYNKGMLIHRSDNS